MRSPAIHPLISNQIRNAGMKGAQIESVAFHLADLLKELHGGEWAIEIDHDALYVAVSKNFDCEHRP